MELKYHHMGIPTGEVRGNEKYLEKYRIHVSGYEESDYGIEWLRFEEDSPLPDIVRTVPHVAFEVSNVREAISGRRVIVEPNSPTDGIIVAFIEENGAPVEFIQVVEGAEGTQIFTRG